MSPSRAAALCRRRGLGRDRIPCIGAHDCPAIWALVMRTSVYLDRDRRSVAGIFCSSLALSPAVDHTSPDDAPAPADGPRSKLHLVRGLVLVHSRGYGSGKLASGRPGWATRGVAEREVG